MAGETEAAVYYEEDRLRTKVGVNPVSFVVFGFTVAVALAVAFTQRAHLGRMIMLLGGGFLLASYLFFAPRVVNQWERAVAFRLGRFLGLRGPGLIWVMPFIDRVSFWIDLRVRATPFSAEKTLTADTVPVDVDAVLFWVVQDAQKAALEVEDYRVAVSWAAQTALRDIIGKTRLAEMLTGREAIDEDLQRLIDARTHDWGINVKSVEVRDVVIPAALEDAMSRQAQAERESQARIILGDAEVAVAEKFEAASQRYVNNPTAFQLRAMNILYEGMKEKGSMLVIPNSVVESLSFGGVAGLAAIGKQGGGGPRTQ